MRSKIWKLNFGKLGEVMQKAQDLKNDFKGDGIDSSYHHQFTKTASKRKKSFLVSPAVMPNEEAPSFEANSFEEMISQLLDTYVPFFRPPVRLSFLSSLFPSFSSCVIVWLLSFLLSNAPFL